MGEREREREMRRKVKRLGLAVRNLMAGFNAN